MQVQLTVLGSGTSSGVPVVGCECSVCTSDNPKNKRLRSSCLFQVNGRNILVDSGPDLRQQCLTHNIKRVDAVLYTHIHADHVHGIDELRLFNAWQKSSIPVYGDPGTLNYLGKTFGYIFHPKVDYPSLVPKLEPHPIKPGPFIFQDITITQIPCHHGDQWMTYNYRIGNVAWLTDTNGIPEESYGYLEGLDYLFIDGLRHKEHPTHFCLEESMKAAERIGAKQTYFIHLAHDYDHDDFDATLPAGFNLAYDGLSVTSA